MRTIDDKPLSRFHTRPLLTMAACCTIGGVINLAVPMVLLAVPLSDTVTVVGSPTADADELTRIVAAAGGSIVSLGGRTNVLIARADTGGFVGRLYGAGARLVLDGRLARLCGRPSRGLALTSRPVRGLGTFAP